MKQRFYKLCVIFFSLLLGEMSVLAQNHEVRGKVVDSKGEPLGGAVVIIKGTANGAMAADDGTYSIKAKKNSILEASLLGYSTEEQEVNGRSVINFTLKDDSVLLEEVVVEVGYGEQRLIDVTGTVSRVSVEDIIKAPVASLDQALQGRVAGLVISSSDGQPGSDMDFVIRGANSLTQNNSPLFVVDGFPMEDFSGAAVSPSEIASVTVLKDASSTAIYGSRGANGVIIIETKKGKRGKPVVNYNMSYGIQRATKKMEMMDAYDFVEYQLERSVNSATTYLVNRGMTLDDYKKERTIDWQDYVFRDAPVMMHNVSVIGGTGQTKYSVSGSAVNQEGVIINSGYEKYSGRLALQQELSPKATLKMNVAYSEDKTYGQTSSAYLSDANSYQTYLMYRCWAYKPVLLDSQDIDDLFDDDITVAGIANTVMNPVVSNNNELINKRSINLRANSDLVFKILPELRLTIKGGYTKRIRRNEEFYNSKTYRGYSSVNNSREVNGGFSENASGSWLNENTLEWSRKRGAHKLNLLGGVTMQGTQSSVYGFTVIKVPDESLGLSGMDDGLAENTNVILSRNTLMSFLGRANYAFGERYLFTTSIRADGSSKFTKGHRWGVFPSAAFAWRFSEEEFMKSLSWLDNGKLRLSYGVTGNNRVGDFSAYGSVVVGDYYAIGNSIAEAITQGNLGNSNLTWESTTQWNIGLDLSTLGSRVNFVVDAYRKVTDNLLLKSNVPYSSGYTSVYKNVGKVRNDGLELTLTTTNIRTRNFLWTSDFNIAFNRDKVLELAEGEETMLSKVAFTGDFNNVYLYMAKVGKPMASFYGFVWDGVYTYDDFDVSATGVRSLKPGVPDNGNETVQPGDIKYVDIDGDGTINDNDMVVIGRATPIHTGGFNNNFVWKNLSLNVFFQWSYGNQIMNANRMVFEGNFANRNINQFKSYADRWSEDNQNSKNFRVGGQGPTGRYSTRTLEDGSFLRLKTVRLSYSIPKVLTSKIKIQSLKLFVSAQNLWTWTSYSGLDPEVSTRHSALTPGFDYSSYARNRTCTCGIDITF